MLTTPTPNEKGISFYRGLGFTVEGAFVVPVRSVSKGPLSTSISCPLSSYLHYPKPLGTLRTDYL